MNKSIVLTFLFTASLFAKDPVKPVYQDDGVAVKGYDVVAYFTAGQPTKGSPAYSHQWMGATWRFANAKHLELFQADPVKYAPQYGGYCAYAVSKGHTASINPKNWKIVDGRLYLNHSLAQGLWEKRIPDNISKADKNWPTIDKLPVQ